MSEAPLVSVVMSVLNDERHLAATLDSVLSQECVDFEFIVIDDGSTDGTEEILEAYAARDPRLRVVHQENAGLTRALIRGCSLAQGTYIARHDGGGDVSLPGRLRIQAAFLESRPEVVMTSCGTRFLGPEGEELYEVVQCGEELNRGLQEFRLDRIRGPSHHGSTLFRKLTYLSVGGYRAAFQVAQDLDLWLRFAESGKLEAIPEILYTTHLTPDSISAKYRNVQIQTARVIVSCAQRRRSGLDEKPLLDEVSSGSTSNDLARIANHTLQNAKFYYFLGSILRRRLPRRAQHYYLRSLLSWRLFPRAFLALCFVFFQK